MPKYVLIAEDDKDILSFVREALEDAGFRVGASVGAETLAAVGRERPDVIVLDHQMPGMDGVRIARELRASAATHDIPIIAMTAAGRAPIICREMDADGCLGKPFDIDHLLETVERLTHMTH